MTSPVLALIRADGSQVPEAFSWMSSITSSGGVPLSHFELSVDSGAEISILKGIDIGKVIWGNMAGLLWNVYLMVCGVAFKFIDWVMGLGWLDLIGAPIVVVAGYISSFMARIDAVPLFIGITCLVAFVWMMRGRWAHSMYEVTLSIVVAALATGVLANPLTVFIGDSTDVTNRTGAIYEAQNLGLQLAAEASGEGASSAVSGSGDQTDFDVYREKQIGKLVDTFVLFPLEAVNFGTTFTHGTTPDGCAAAYVAALKKGPYGYDSDALRKAVKNGDSCDAGDDAYDYASNPNAGMVLAVLLCLVFAGIIVWLAVLIAGSVLTAGCLALYAGLKLCVTLVTGILPGGMRRPMFIAFSELVVGLGLLTFTTFFLGGYLFVIQQIFISTTGSAIERILLMGALMWAGLVVFVRQRRQILESTNRLADLMGSGGFGARGQGSRAASFFMQHDEALVASTAVAALRGRRARANDVGHGSGVRAGRGSALGDDPAAHRGRRLRDRFGTRGRSRGEQRTGRGAATGLVDPITGEPGAAGRAETTVGLATGDPTALVGRMDAAATRGVERTPGGRRRAATSAGQGATDDPARSRRGARGVGRGATTASPGTSRRRARRSTVASNESLALRRRLEAARGGATANRAGQSSAGARGVAGRSFAPRGASGGPRPGTTAGTTATGGGTRPSSRTAGGRPGPATGPSGDGVVPTAPRRGTGSSLRTSPAGEGTRAPRQGQPGTAPTRRSPDGAAGTGRDPGARPVRPVTGRGFDAAPRRRTPPQDGDGR